MYYFDVVLQSEYKKKDKERRKAHLDTFDSSFFFVHDDSIDVAPEDNGYSCLVFALSRLAEVDHAPANA